MVKGHAVMTMEGKYKVASYIWKDLCETDEEARWVGEDVGGEDHDPRQRLREKTTLAGMQV